ncbi:hypothetical protein Tco_0820094 [Tanacetum coccineum]|uniref:Uncharacterized protein n=1 Tax=Tanacetum coccineum TaxID=301880 RepID=A0ABQ5A8D7_9ASTR
MIQPEPKGSTQGYPLVSGEVLRFYTSAGNPVKEILLKLNLPDHRILKDGGEGKEFQRSFRHSDIERLSRSDEVLKLKNFKKDATLKLFKSTNQESKIIDTTRAQQKALDDNLVTPANHLKIGKSNLRLSSNLKSKEPTLQVALDALKLTSFYKAFKITADVPEIYMQEFWFTISRHHSLLRFKMNGKSHTVNVDNFKEMLQICPKLPGQKFKDPLFKEEILFFIRDLRHTGEIKVLSDVNVNHMHQPWRSFAAIINKCLSGKTTALESLRLSRAQIL